MDCALLLTLSTAMQSFIDLMERLKRTKRNLAENDSYATLLAEIFLRIMNARENDKLCFEAEFPAACRELIANRFQEWCVAAVFRWLFAHVAHRSTRRQGIYAHPW